MHKITHSFTSERYRSDCSLEVCPAWWHPGPCTADQTTVVQLWQENHELVGGLERTACPPGSCRDSASHLAIQPRVFPSPTVLELAHHHSIFQRRKEKNKSSLLLWTWPGRTCHPVQPIRQNLVTWPTSSCYVRLGNRVSRGSRCPCISNRSSHWRGEETEGC